MKKCIKCGVEKELDEFLFIKLSNKYRNQCKQCRSVENKIWRRKNLIHIIYTSQKNRSIKKFNIEQDYKEDEFVKWIISQPNFKKLESQWISSGYKKDLKPSVDRIDSKKGYTKNNIRLMTWEENRILGDQDQRDGLLGTTFPPTPIYQIDKKTSNIVNGFKSQKEASRLTGFSQSSISNALNGWSFSAGGYKWIYQNKYNNE